MESTLSNSGIPLMESTLSNSGIPLFFD